jgi:hypothetical protein
MGLLSLVFPRLCGYNLIMIKFKSVLALALALNSILTSNLAVYSQSLSKAFAQPRKPLSIEFFSDNRALAKWLEKAATAAGVDAYDAYQKVLFDYKSAREYGLPPSQIYPLIDKEGSALASKILSDPIIKSERRKQIIDTVGNACISIILILATAKFFRPITGRAAAAYSSSFTAGKVSGTLLTNGQLWKVGVSSMIFEMALISVVLKDLYENFSWIILQYADYKELEEADYFKRIWKPALDSYEQSNDDLCQSPHKGKHTNVWANEQTRRSALVLLYAIRSIDDYINKSTNRYKYHVALFNYMELLVEGKLFEPQEIKFWEDEFNKMYLTLKERREEQEEYERELFYQKYGIPNPNARPYEKELLL